MTKPPQTATPVIILIEQEANITLNESERMAVRIVYADYITGITTKVPLTWNDRLTRLASKQLISAARLKEGVLQPSGIFRQAIIRNAAGTIGKYIKTNKNHILAR